jgi:predicted histone-like DNA-binding protein
MAVKYKLIEKINPQDSKLPKKVYASAIHDKHFKLSQLAKELAGRSTTASEGDTFSVLIGLRDLIREHTGRGDRVTIDGIGSFVINAISEGADSPEKFYPANIKGGKLVFQPDSEMKEFINNVKFEKA